MDIGQKIRSIRDKLGLSQKELLNQTQGITQPEMSNLENGYISTSTKRGKQQAEKVIVAFNKLKGKNVSLKEFEQFDIDKLINIYTKEENEKGPWIPLPYLIWLGVFLVIGIVIMLIYFTSYSKRPSYILHTPQPIGKILHPQSNTQFDKNEVEPYGYILNFDNNKHHAWLVMELLGDGKTLFWPKGRELYINPLDSGSWGMQIQEDGTDTLLSLSIFLMNEIQNKNILEWMKKGISTGQYPPIDTMPGQRLYRVSNLSFPKKGNENN